MTFFPNIEAVREYDHQLANDPRNFARCVEHLYAAPGGDEFHQRMLALRIVRNAKPPAFEPSQLDGRQALRWNRYESELLYLRGEQRAAMRHLEKLKARGISPKQFSLHPYQSRSQRRRERERMLFIKNCVRRGEPISWENLQRR